MTEAHAPKAVVIVAVAEHQIQKIMLDLDGELREMGMRVDHVRVDTRRWANMQVEILFEDARR